VASNWQVLDSGWQAAVHCMSKPADFIREY